MTRHLFSGRHRSITVTKAVIVRIAAAMLILESASSSSSSSSSSPSSSSFSSSLSAQHHTRRILAVPQEANLVFSQQAMPSSSLSSVRSLKALADEWTWVKRQPHRRRRNHRRNCISHGKKRCSSGGGSADEDIRRRKKSLLESMANLQEGSSSQNLNDDYDRGLFEEIVAGGRGGRRSPKENNNGEGVDQRNKSGFLPRGTTTTTTTTTTSSSSSSSSSMHLRDRFITLYGRKPVIEALMDPNIEVDKLVIARGVRGELIQEILRAADERGIKVKRCSADAVNRVSGNPRQDQGVALDIEKPKEFLDEYVNEIISEGLPLRPIIICDNVRNANNIGMIVRSATAAGAHAIIIPRKGCPEVGPMVVKASAGVALRARMVHCNNVYEAARTLKENGVQLIGLSGRPDAEDLYSLSEEMVSKGLCSGWILGNESDGISHDVEPLVDKWVKIPMEGNVESLNVATAASIVLFELLRRRRQQ